MRFEVLGRLVVRSSDGEVVGVPETRVRALLADLLTVSGRPLSVDRLVDDLWDTPPARPAAAVQTRVWRLRRALEAAEPGGRSLVVSGPAGYRLDVPREAIDAHRFEDLLTRAREDGDLARRVALLEEALGLWRGPAYADFGDEAFVLPEVRRLTELRMLALEESAEARLALGGHGPLVGELAVLVAEHPLRERLRAAHIRALYASGRQSEALENHRDLSERLREELGVDPSPELVDLQRAILAQDPALEPRRRDEPPEPLTELVGREDAVARVRSLFDEGRRLVTLTGPGGVGKTRLALGIATRAPETFPGRVRLVEPAGAGGVAEIVDTMAAALDLREDAVVGSSAVERLVEALRTRETLLILDNCEHVIGPVAELTGRLLRECPRLRVLATSREPLNLAGETVWPVPPLDLASATRLFVARAADAVPGFVVHPDRREAVEAICRRLDGLPLALELAATRVRAMEVHELADRLDDRFRLLDVGRRGVPERQQTLRAMIDWSWEPLTEPERTVLRRLAVHADGCDLEAAEAVCSDDELPRSSVLPLLATLVDRSLVTVVRGASGTRYRLLESVAAYCLERLDEAGDREETERRHVDHHTALAEEAERGLRGQGQCAWSERLDRETADLRLALDRAVRSGEGETALRLVNAQAWYWFLRGRLSEGRRSLDRALEVAGRGPDTERVRTARAWERILALWGGDPVHGDPFRAAEELDGPRERARAIWLMSTAVTGGHDVSANVARFDRALEASRETNDRWGTAGALAGRAEQAILLGDLDGARRDAERGLTLFEGLGDAWGRLQAMGVLAKYAEITEDYEEAARLHREGLGAAEELSLWPEVSYRLSGLGRIALLTGDLEAARSLHERALRVAVDRSATSAEQFAEVGLAMVARRQGRLDDAERYLQRWVGWLEDLAGDAGTALIKAELGFIAELRGDVVTAYRRHEEGLVAARRTGDPRALALAMEGLAGAEALAGHHEKAARLLGEAAEARASVGAPLPEAERGDIDRITAAVREALGAHDGKPV
ncbi:BTAD domain-containing putative transcriptional regulator [Nocardiopsis alba]|uniref:BTAD domain-containing putative transcriptional regulator n=1 Tax=Nocardiopsis alba TaxID=53437 RepID=UPI0033A83C5D